MANAVGKNIMSDNELKYITFFELCSKVDSNESAIDFALKTRILPSKTGLDCMKCNTQGSVVWTKRLSHSSIPFILFCPACRTKWSLSKCTIFSGSAISLKQFFQSLYCWLLGLPPRDAAVESNLSLLLIQNHYTLNREVCYVALSSESKVLGGPGQTIEISDLIVCRRRLPAKAAPTRDVAWAKEGAYIGYNVDTREVFVVKVNRIDLNTLLEVLTTMVLPGSKVVVDAASKYSEFEIENYDMVFVREPMGVPCRSEPHRIQVDIPENLRQGRTTEYSLMLLEKVYFLRKGHEIAAHRFYPFLADVARVYPGYGQTPLRSLPLHHFATAD